MNTAEKGKSVPGPHDSILRKEVRRGYTHVANELCDADGLSFRAKGIALVLLSKPDDWVIKIAYLVKLGKEGEEAIRTAMRELAEYGFMKRIREQGARGRWRTVTLIADYPAFINDGTAEDRFYGYDKAKSDEAKCGRPKVKKQPPVTDMAISGMSATDMAVSETSVSRTAENRHVLPTPDLPIPDVPIPEAEAENSSSSDARALRAFIEAEAKPLEFAAAAAFSKHFLSKQLLNLLEWLWLFNGLKPDDPQDINAVMDAAEFARPYKKHGFENIHNPVGFIRRQVEKSLQAPLIDLHRQQVQEDLRGYAT